MLSSTEILNAVELVALAGCGLAAMKLVSTRLHRRYRVLFLSLAFRFLNLAIILSFFRDERSYGYQKEWVIAQPFFWLLNVLMVLELYSLILEKYKGLATLGRWFQCAGFSISIAISVLTLLPKIHSVAAQRSMILGYYFAVERGLDCSMLVFLLLILAWLTRYPIPLSRNILVHSVVYSVLFLSDGLSVLTRVFLGLQLSRQFSMVMVGFYAACMFGWFFGLSAKGEEIRMSIPHFSTEQERRILQQLEALNRTLLKVSRN